MDVNSQKMKTVQIESERTRPSIEVENARREAVMRGIWALALEK